MSGGFDAFHSLDEEKQQRIIRAALVEFAVKGFKRASTNAIAENAKIGKGMLFYYFGSKEELFDFLCEYTIEFMRTKYVNLYESNTGDFIERYKVLTEVKRKVMSEFPEIISFFESFYHEENAPYFDKFSKDIIEIRKLIYGKIYDNIDYSLFRYDLDGKAVVNYLKWLFQGYEADITERFKRGEVSVSDETALASEWSKFYAFTDNLRQIFYKEDNHNGHH